MSKTLSEMSLKELWTLFPIILKEHKSYWRTWFYEEMTLLHRSLPEHLIKRISHIGSTAIDGIWAKPIVDILVEANEKVPLHTLSSNIINAGYTLMSENTRRISFNKGYTENGFSQRVFHLHLRMPGDNDELYFRDYLCTHPDIAKEYESLKLALWKKYEHDRDGYTDAKTDFICKYTTLAKSEFLNKYA